MLMMPETSGPSILEIVTAFATLSAAVAAAISAWISQKSTHAALENLEEARLSRRDELLPRFILERDFENLDFRWPGPGPNSGRPLFGANKASGAENPFSPTFTLSNFGQGPAYEVRVIFELFDDNGELDVPLDFEGLGISNGIPPPNQPDIPVIMFTNANGGTGLPLYRRERIDFPHLVPGCPRSIELPSSICARLFTRGLQYRQRTDRYKDIVLIVFIEGYTAERELIVTQFRFHVNPFCHGPNKVVRVFHHFWELPVLPDEWRTRPPLW